MSRRVNIKAILADPVQREGLMVSTIIATQAREGVETTPAQAQAAYRKVQEERAVFKRESVTFNIRYMTLLGARYLHAEDVASFIRKLAATEETDVRTRLEQAATNLVAGKKMELSAGVDPTISISTSQKTQAGRKEQAGRKKSVLR